MMEKTGKQFTGESLKRFLAENRTRLAYDSWVSVEKKFFYINIPKTGCTKVKKMLQALCDLPVPEGVSPIHARASGEFVKSIFDYSLEEQLYLLNGDEVSRISFVRNPYTRILSGYWNKIAGPKKYGQFNEAIFRDMGIENAQSLPSFTEFLNFILKFNKNHLDIHFRPQSTICHFDHIDYNQIGYYENLQNDLVRIFKQLGANQQILDTVSIIENPSANDTTLNAELLEHLKQTDLGERFYDFFKNDFLSFNYAKL